MVSRPLVPDNAGPFERSHSTVNAERLAALAVAAALLRTLWDPWRCPAAQLPLLAWAFSVDIWDQGWSIERQRRVVAEARAFHRAKTTLRGYRMALSYLDAELVRAHRPRDAFYAAPSPTRAQTEAWLATLPEIRIYLSSPLTRPGRAGVYGGRAIARSVERIVLDRRRAELRRNGEIVPLVFSGVRADGEGRLLTEPERLLVPGPPAGRMRAGGFVGAAVSDGRLAGERVIPLSFNPGGDDDLPPVLAPSLKPVDAKPRRVAEARPAGLGFFANRPRRRRGVRVSDADLAFYDSLRLAEAGVPLQARVRNSVGKSRLRRAACTIGLLVHAPRPPLASRFPAGRVARRPPNALIESIDHAVSVASAARDAVSVDVNSTRPLAYADLPAVGASARYGLAVRR